METKKKGFVKTVLVLCGLVALSGCETIVNQFAFYPDNRNIIPAERLPSFVEEIFIITTDNIRLQAYYAEHSGSDRLLIFFHGNAGNIGHRLFDIERLNRCGINVLAVSYRGYGKSSGTPSEAGIYRDGSAALDYAQSTLGYPLDHIIIFGRSIGTTVAVHISRQADIAGLILVTPLTSGKAHAKAHGMGILSFLAGDAFDNLSKISEIKCPLLVIHGTNDSIIPFSMGREIYDHAPAEKKLVVIDGAGHNNLPQVDPDKYWGSIRQFIGMVNEADDGLSP